MQARNAWCAIIMILLCAVATPSAGQVSPSTAPSVKKGDPPPRNALSLSISQAQSMLGDAIKQRYVGTFKSCQRVLMVRGCITDEISPAADIQVRSSGFELTAPYSERITAGRPNSDSGKVFVNFKKLGDGKSPQGGEIDPEDYLEAFLLGSSDPKGGAAGGGVVAGKVNWSPHPVYCVGYLPKPYGDYLPGTLVMWTSETPARQFADAFNRLLYAATQHEEFKMFSAAAKAWRDNPVKPPLSAEADRQRVLAENAIKEKNLDSAAQHYESGLEIQPTWPAGWFNLALIYAEQNKYGDAGESMEHYLELVPDAADAKAAREQMFIWEDKAKQPVHQAPSAVR